MKSPIDFVQQYILKSTLTATFMWGVLSGCASTGQSNQLDSGSVAIQSCATTSCIRDQVAKQVSKQCVSDLFWYESRSKTRQEQINAEYRYPLTSWQTFHTWSRLGQAGPAPVEWCRGYAQAKLRRQGVMGVSAPQGNALLSR